MTDSLQEPRLPERGAARGFAVVAALVLVGVTLAVYANSLHGPFVFDDLPSIRDNPNVRSLTPLSRSLTAPPGTGASGRPLVALSLAINHAIGGLEPLSYHLFNVLVHALASLALFGLVRRGLEATSLAERALPLAFTSALLWAVHPLHTDALNHVVYRNEAMAALFYLATLYAAVRGFRSERSAGWYALAAIACALAMASKETAVSAPLAVLALDGTLFSPGFRAALRRRSSFYLALASTWVVLAASIASGGRGASAGFDQGFVSSFEYLRTQVAAIAQYLRLSFWPDELLFDYYGWPAVRSWGEVWLRGLLLLALLVASGWAFAGRRVAGFLGLLFFAALAPSSSFIPLSGEMIAEHRTYLPLAALVLLVVLGVHALLARTISSRLALAVGAVAVALGTGALAWRTVVRNADYRSTEALWATVLERFPDHARAHQMLGQHHLHEEDFAAALPRCREAMRVDPRLASLALDLGTALLMTGEPVEALPHLQQAVLDEPEKAAAHAQLGLCQQQLGRREEAERYLRRAVELEPEDAVLLHNLASFLIGVGRYAEAEEVAHRVIATNPDYVAGHHDLAAAQLNAGRAAESVPHFRRAVELEPGVGRRYFHLGLALEHAGQAQGALARYAEASRLDPGSGAPLRIVRLLAAHPDPAVRDGELALRWIERFTAGPGPPDDASLLDLLAMAQAETGRFDEALSSARRALALCTTPQQQGLAAEIRGRVALYERGQPYRIEAW